MIGMKRHTVESILGKTPVALSPEESAGIDRYLSDEINRINRKFNYQDVKSINDAGRIYVWK